MFGPPCVRLVFPQAKLRRHCSFRIYYPNGNTAEDTNNVLQLVQHWYRMTNRSPPSQLLAVACPQPVF